MKRILLLGAALFSLNMQGWAEDEITIDHTVGAFDKIVAEGMITLNLTQGNTNKVSVETDKAWQEDVKVEVKDGTLTVLASKKLEKSKVRSTVNVSYKELRALKFVGNKDKKPRQGAKLGFDNAAKGDSLSIHLEGVDLAKLDYDVKFLSLYVDGANSLRLRGKADNQQVKKRNVKVEERNGDKKYNSGNRRGINIIGWDGGDFSDAVIAIVALTGIFFAPFASLVLIVFFILRAQRNKQKQQIELYAKAMEVGKEVPANLFVKPTGSLLNRGIIWAMLGVGTMLSFGLTMDASDAAWGIIPLCVGVAYLLMHYLGKKRENNDLR